jgi:hypothetical protein
VQQCDFVKVVACHFWLSPNRGGSELWLYDLPSPSILMNSDVGPRQDSADDDEGERRNDTLPDDCGDP